MSNDVLNLEDLENQDFSVGKEESPGEKRVPFLPAKAQVWPFDIRILINPISSELGRPNHEAHVHQLQIGGKWINVPCLRTLNKACYMCDTRWKAFDKIKELEARGANVETSPNHAQYKAATIVAEMYKQKKQYMFLAAKRNDPEIYIFYAGPALVKEIFGDKVKGKQGALHTIKEFGVSLFAPNQPTGWISVNKTGKKLDTVYSASAAMISVMEGKSKRMELLEEALHPTILEKFNDVNSLPRVLENYKNRLWSEEEMQAFVDSNGTTIPEKIAKFIRSSTPAVEPTEKIDTAFGGNTSVEDFDPF